MSVGPYRSLPVVQTYRVEVSSCAKCKHEWSMVDSDHRRHSWCDLVWHGGTLEIDRRAWYERSDAGKCTRFVPTFWEQAKQWLGLSKCKLYETTLEPAKVRGACTVCKARPGEQCDAEIHYSLTCNARLHSCKRMLTSSGAPAVSGTIVS